MSTNFLYKCECCGYQTNVKFNMNRHKNRKNQCKSAENVTKISPNVSHNSLNVTQNSPNVSHGSQNVTQNSPNVSHDSPNVTVNECHKCKRIFRNLFSLQRHLPICKGVDQLTCHICFKRFSHRNSKYKHLKNVNCKPPPKAECIPLENNKTVIDNSTNNSNNNIMTNSHNNNTITNNVTINAFGKEDLEYIVNNPEFMKQCLKEKEYGLIECLKKIHYNQDQPQNQNIKKLNKKDDFVDIYDGSKWKLRMIDYAYTLVMNNLEKVFTDYIDNLAESDDWTSVKRIVKTFCNKVSTVLDWEFNNLDRDHEVQDTEMKDMQQKLKRLITETLYRETVNT